MSVCREHEGEFRHLLAVSSVYCWQTVRMVVRLDGISILIVILISIYPVIIWDTSILSLAIWVLFSYFPFFTLKGVRKIDL